MVGISGTKLTPETISLFSDTHAGGLIVFRPNFESAKQFKQLISSLEQALGRELLVAVDHEGGRVIHLSEGVTIFPDNLVLGKTQNEEYARLQGEVEARELSRLWIDVNLSPTLDVLTENFSPNIGIRSYGKDSELVARLGSARIKSMQAGGVSACAKHFPGQGQSSTDAHLGLPVLETDWDELKRVHLKPFLAAMNAGVASVMSSHPVYPNLDPSKVPATFSKRIIRDFLRKEIGFRGVIFSDDLEMGALKNLCSIGTSAVKAVAAGHDMVLVCHDANNAREVYESLCSAYRKKELHLKNLEESVYRIKKIKKIRSVSETVFQEEKGKFVAELIARDGICSLDVFEHPCTVIFPRLSALADKIFIEKEMLDEEAYVRQLFNARLDRVVVVGIEPKDSEIDEACALASTSDSVIFFCFDAHLYPQTRKLLELIQVKSSNCAVVLLRDPYDREFVREGTVCVDTYGFRSVQIQQTLRQTWKNQIPSKASAIKS